MAYTVKFQPDNVSIEADEGENLLAAAAKAGVYIHAFCGGDGVCGKCKVNIDSGKVSAEKATLKQDDWDQGFRLACKTTIRDDLQVTVPEMTKADGKALKTQTQEHPFHLGPGLLGISGGAQWARWDPPRWTQALT